MPDTSYNKNKRQPRGSSFLGLSGLWRQRNRLGRNLLMVVAAIMEAELCESGGAD